MTNPSKPDSPLQQIRQTYHELMMIPHDELWAVDAMVATIMATKLHRNDEPVCIMLVGPSGWGKTEMMRPILGWNGVGINYSSGTPRAFASGSPGPSKSLLNKMDRRVLVIKDFTGIMANPEARSQFFSTIRDAYDGSSDRHSGATGKSVSPQARFCIFAAVVPQMYTRLEYDQDLGYRYLLIWVRKTHTHDYQDRIQDMINTNWNQRNLWRDHIKTRVRRAFEVLRVKHNTGPDNPPTQKVGEPDNLFEVRAANYAEEQVAGFHRIEWPDVALSPEYQQWVKAASRIIASIRLGSGNPDRAKEDSPSYTGKSEQPGPFRAQKQLNVLAHMRAVADYRTVLGEDEIEFGRAICRDTIAPGRLLMLDALYRDAIGIDAGLTRTSLHGAIQRIPEYVDTVVDHLVRTEFFHEDSGGGIHLSKSVLADITTARLAPRS